MRVRGVRANGSIGIAGYCDRLATALGPHGVAYEPATAPRRGVWSHFHLGNSSRRALLHFPTHRGPCVVTVHDVVPRDRRLMALYRHVAYPLLVRRATVLVAHSAAAADMLVRLAGARPERILVIPHPVPHMAVTRRADARAALGWPEHDRLALLPGVLKPAKLIDLALAATAQTGWRLALCGQVRDAGLVRAARAAGALVLVGPDRSTYEQAFAAADAVLVLREGTVGETNGPLLEALSAGRAVLASRTGSIPEVAGGGALLCEPTSEGIRRGLADLADLSERAERERLAAERARLFDQGTAAAAHAELFVEVFGG